MTPVIVLRPWLPKLFAKLTDRQRKRLCSTGITTKKVGKTGKTHVLLGCVWAPEILIKCSTVINLGLVAHCCGQLKLIHVDLGKPYASSTCSSRNAHSHSK